MVLRARPACSTVVVQRATLAPLVAIKRRFQLRIQLFVARTHVATVVVCTCDAPRTMMVQLCTCTTPSSVSVGGRNQPCRHHADHATAPQQCHTTATQGSCHAPGTCRPPLYTTASSRVHHGCVRGARRRGAQAAALRARAAARVPAQQHNHSTRCDPRAVYTPPPWHPVPWRGATQLWWHSHGASRQPRPRGGPTGSGSPW